MAQRPFYPGETLICRNCWHIFKDYAPDEQCEHCGHKEFVLIKEHQEHGDYASHWEPF